MDFDNAYGNDRLSDTDVEIANSDLIDDGQHEAPWNGQASKVYIDSQAGKTTNHIISKTERLAELERRENALEISNAELEKIDGDIRAQLFSSGRNKKNWPCAYWPIARHDISEDIREGERYEVRKMYGLFLLNFLALGWNFFCNVVAWLWIGTSVSLSFWSFFYMLFWVNFSWILWYKKYYKVHVGVSKLGMIYFGAFGMIIVFACFMAIGFENFGSVGLLSCIRILKVQPTLGIFYLVATILWALVILIGIPTMKRQHREYGQQISQNAN